MAGEVVSLSTTAQHEKLHLNLKKILDDHYFNLSKNNQKYTYKLGSCSNFMDLMELKKKKTLLFNLVFGLALGRVLQKVSKTTQRIGLMQRNFHNFDNHTFLFLYKSFTRPLLEYGTTLYSPFFKQETRALSN